MQNKFFGSKLNTVLLVILIILMIVALRWMLGNKRIYQDKAYNPIQLSTQFDNPNIPNKSESDWIKSPTFGLYYSSNFTAPTEFYRVSGLGPDRGNIVYEPSANTVPVFYFVFSDGKTMITWGDTFKGAYMPGTCTNDEFGPFEYGVSSVACVKGYRTWVAHFSARDSVSNEELKIFGDFVLKNK